MTNANSNRIAFFALILLMIAAISASAQTVLVATQDGKLLTVSSNGVSSFAELPLNGSYLTSLTATKSGNGKTVFASNGADIWKLTTHPFMGAPRADSKQVRYNTWTWLRSQDAVAMAMLAMEDGSLYAGSIYGGPMTRLKVGEDGISSPPMASERNQKVFGCVSIAANSRGSVFCLDVVNKGYIMATKDGENYFVYVADPRLIDSMSATVDAETDELVVLTNKGQILVGSSLVEFTSQGQLPYFPPVLTVAYNGDGISLPRRPGKILANGRSYIFVNSNNDNSEYLATINPTGRLSKFATIDGRISAIELLK